MTTKTDEVFQESILAMRDWLAFLEEKRIEINDQLERARKRMDNAPAETGATQEVPVTEGAEETPVVVKDSWL